MAPEEGYPLHKPPETLPELEIPSRESLPVSVRAGSSDPETTAAEVSDNTLPGGSATMNPEQIRKLFDEDPL